MLLLAALSAASAASTDIVILHLKNGDRLAGELVAEDTNRVLITTSWIRELSVPQGEIVSREKPSVLQWLLPATNAVAVSTNPAFAKAMLPPPPKHMWKGEARVGADFLVGGKNQETFYGRFKLAYERPFAWYPKESFRNVLDLDGSYGRTEGIVSANRVYGTSKTELDIGKRFYVYNLGGAGYDEIRKIDFGFEIGPGLGYHLLTQTNFQLGLEAGIDYQFQDRSDNTTTEHLYPRVAELLVWKVNHHVSIDERLEFFPALTTGNYRARFETTLSYGIWQNLSLNCSLLDTYDSQPATNVPENDLQVRSSIGIRF